MLPIYSQKSRMWKTLRWVILVISLVTLAFLYIRTIKLDLPYRYHVDEDYFFISALQIRQTGLQPNVLYPPFAPYLTSLISVAMDAAYGNQPIPNEIVRAAQIYLAGRLFNALATIMACCFMYQIGRKLHSVEAGLVLLWLFGADPSVFLFSYQIHGDSFAYLFAAGSLYFALVVFQNPRARRAFWLSLFFMFFAVTAKYSIAPLAVFPAYMLLRRLMPRVRHQILVVCLMLAAGLGVVFAIRIWGQPLKKTFESAGFLFLFTDQPFNSKYFQLSFGQLQGYLPGAILLSVAVFVIAVLILKWKVFNKAQRIAYVLLILTTLATLPLMSMLSMRYRDLFVLPYALYILWAVSFGFLVSYIPQGRGLLLLGGVGLLIAASGYLSDFRQSDFLRQGDSRVLASQWLETHIHRPTGIAKVYTVGDFLPHVNGYPGGAQSWTITSSILDKTAEDWWASGIVYAITDTRDTKHTWYSNEDDKAAFKGFTLAYQTPSDYQGPGPKYGIFYTFEVKTPNKARLGDLAEIFGQNIDFTRMCPATVLPMRVFLRALRITDIFYETELILRDAAGHVVYTERQTPAAGRQPTTYWQQYDLIFDDHRLHVPATISPGVYQLEFAIFEPYHKEHLAVWDKDEKQQGETVRLGQLEIIDCPAGTTPPVAPTSSNLPMP